MKQLSVFSLFLLASLVINAQTARSINNSCGTSYSNSTASLKVSVGEPIVGTHHNTGGTFSQGFFRAKPQPAVVISETAYSAYPNPCKDELLLKGDLTKVKQVQLYDMAGRLVLQFPFISNNIRLSGINSGVYTLRLLGDSNSILHYVKLSKL